MNMSVIESDNSFGDTEESMDINDDFVFFALNPKDSSKCQNDKTYCPNIYGCNRKDEYVYEIVSSKFIHHLFAVDGNKIVFNLWDSVKADIYKSDLLFVGDLTTKQIKKIADWSVYGKMQMKYPIVAFRDYVSNNPLILNLESNTTRKITDLKCNEPPKIDNRHLVCIGKYQPYASKLTSDESWAVDLETYEIVPISVLEHNSVEININGIYALVDSGRDFVYYDNQLGQLSGEDIYSFDLKTKREE